MDHNRQQVLDRVLIVIVDDDATVRNSLKFSLEIEGYAVHAFSLASELLDGNVPDCACLVVDQNMPGMSGLELVTKLRNERLSTPAILITSDPRSAIKDRAARAGIPIVEKPFLVTR
jgi:two-component system, LuxR family, response regulator FixJ